MLATAHKQANEETELMVISDTRSVNKCFQILNGQMEHLTTWYLYLFITPIQTVVQGIYHLFKETTIGKF